MKTRTFERISRGWSWSMVLALVAALGCGGQEASDAALASSDSAATVASTAPDFSPTFFVARQDLRMCPSPLCGGFFVSAANQSKLVCPDGSSGAECHVSGIDLSALKLPSDQELQVRNAIGSTSSTVGVLFQGKLVLNAATTSMPALSQLVAAHAWLAPAPAAVKGWYVGFYDTGVVCFRAPCPSIRGLLLDTTVTSNVSQVDLSAAPGTAKDKAAALAALTNGDGLIATGPSSPVTTNSLLGSVFRANQFFLLVKPYDPCATVKCSTGYHCEPSAVECLVAPCPPVGVCVADPVRCGGIAGIKCPGIGQCVDDPSDDCDPTRGGVDCGGICQCPTIPPPCAYGTLWNPSPSVCACVPTPVTCGKNTCPAGEYCCNASCGMCAPRGAMCIQIACDATAQ